MIDESLVIRAAPARVFAAFFDPAALATWWQVARSITTPRPLGVYAVEWDATEERDEILGRLGGVFSGRVVDVRKGQEFYVADAWWLPPDGDPLGPMGLHVTCVAEGGGCRVRVQQQGGEDTPRWRHYYELTRPGWRSALETLRHCLEQSSR
ncbi:MAG: SRPBCC domain-containing protein [Acidobacteria bacterium]|nr:SRPBCC domain-containing protein [Acidobacteriota bacterium]